VAQPSTPLTIELELANVERGVSESLVIKTARHPSETAERVWLRLLAFAWQWRPGMSLGSSICEPDEPDLAVQDATGKTTAMVFVGKPEPRRVLKARSRASAAAAAILFESSERLRAFRLACEEEEVTARIEDVECAAVEQELLRALAAWDERRMSVSITLSGDTFYLARGGQDISGELSR
jgi:uncharacterized protein YaeQ